MDKDIIIGGACYGRHNIGDEAILLSILKGFPDDNITVVSHGSEWIHSVDKNIKIRKIPIEYIKPKLGFYTTGRKRVFANAQLIKNDKEFYRGHDYYICGGGTVLSDWTWHTMRTVNIAGGVGTPVVLWGVGMADVVDPGKIDFIKHTLNKQYVKRVYCRDEFVKARVIACGVDSSKVSVSYDPVISLRGEGGEIGRYLTARQLELYKNGNKNFVCSVSGEADISERTPIPIIAAALDDLQKSYNANVFIIPTGCSEHCKDLEFVDLIEKICNNPNITSVKKEFDPISLIKFLENVSVIISSRLHMNIFGACAGTPSIGLVRNSKIIDFSTLLSLPYIEMNDISEELIRKNVDDILAHSNSIRFMINDRVTSMRIRYAEALSELHNLIG